MKYSNSERQKILKRQFKAALSLNFRFYENHSFDTSLAMSCSSPFMLLMSFCISATWG